MFECGACAMLCIYGMFVICRCVQGSNVWVVYMCCVYVLCCVCGMYVYVWKGVVCVVYMCYVGGMCGVWHGCGMSI